MPVAALDPGAAGCAAGGRRLERRAVEVEPGALEVRLAVRAFAPASTSVRRGWRSRTTSGPPTPTRLVIEAPRRSHVQALLRRSSYCFPRLPGRYTFVSVSEPGGTSRKFDRSIVEGPIGPAVWKLAWPTMLQNVIAGLQGIIDHAMVGHFVGYTANAAIGVSWQIILVVIVFISSLFTGMARAGGALRRRQPARQGQPRRLPGVPDRVRTVDHPGGGRVLRGAVAARARERRARRAGRGAAVPARDVHGHLRHDDVLHAERRLPRRRRSRGHRCGSASR